MGRICLPALSQYAILGVDAGANGLVGLHTARILLDEGFEVIGYD